MQRAIGGWSPPWNRLEGAIPLLCNPIKKPRQGKTFSTPRRQASQVNANHWKQENAVGLFHCLLKGVNGY